MFIHKKMYWTIRFCYRQYVKSCSYFVKPNKKSTGKREVMKKLMEEETRKENLRRHI